jgi:hypothetical protein
MTVGGRRVRYEDLLRWFAVAGEIAFFGAVAAALLGLAMDVLEPFYGSTLRFLFAVLLVTAPYAELLEVRERRLRRMSLEERLGFAPHVAPSTGSEAAGRG